MVNYKSPLGEKKSQVQPMKEAVIPDESPQHTPSVSARSPQMFQMDDAAIRDFNARMNPQTPNPTEEQASLEQQFREAREAKRLGKERLSDGAKRRIEMLMNMTRASRTVDIEGNVFILQSLRSEELEEAVLEASAFDGNVRSPFQIRKQLLARSLVQIAGVDASQFFGASDLSTKLEAIDLLDHFLLSRLYEEYLLMVKDTRERYAIKSDADAKEVVEDLKK